MSGLNETEITGSPHKTGCPTDTGSRALPPPSESPEHSQDKPDVSGPNEQPTQQAGHLPPEPRSCQLFP